MAFYRESQDKRVGEQEKVKVGSKSEKGFEEPGRGVLENLGERGWSNKRCGKGDVTGVRCVMVWGTLTPLSQVLRWYSDPLSQWGLMCNRCGGGVAGVRYGMSDL